MGLGSFLGSLGFLGGLRVFIECDCDVDDKWVLRVLGGIEIKFVTFFYSFYSCYIL